MKNYPMRVTHPSAIVSLLIAFVLTAFASILSTSAWGTSSTGDGYVDSAQVADGKLVLQGWAGAANPAQKIIALSISIDGKQIHQGPFERFERPDVVEATKRPDWLLSGWRLSVRLADEIHAGKYVIAVTAIPDAGPSIKLGMNEAANEVSLSHGEAKHKTLIRTTKAILLITVALLVLTFVFAEHISCRIFKSSVSAPHVFSSAIVLSFVICVALGLTGSSINLGIKQTPFISSDLAKIWGSEQPIRSDEWLVLTPLAIGQFNHQPANPVINTNHGEDGQNMLIIGMTGVPVAHTSQIAKPATWGFFLFDLKRALAWDWCFPFFSCLLALWAVLCTLIPGQWRSNFIGALIFTVSPYVVGWSLWPAYATFFPCLVFLAFLKIIHTESTPAKALYSLLLGIAFAGFVFILYPPWQVSLGYVFVALTIGIVIRDQLYKKINFSTTGFFLLALSVSGLLVGLWWKDAKPAIEAMENTVYPGQRTTVLGGNLSLPFILRGFTNIETLHSLSSPLSNQSEIASFYYVLLPLLAAFLLAARRKTLGAVEISLGVFISFTLIFMTVGIPEALAKYSMWGRVPSNRADIGLGLSALILACLLVSRARDAQPNSVDKLLAAFISVAWVVIAYKSIHDLDNSILAGLSSSVILAVLIATGAIGYSLIIGSKKEFLAISLALGVATTATLNPLSIAPTKIANKLNHGASAMIGPADSVVTLNSTLPSMFLVASGVHATNGIYYYPQRSIWQSLDPEHQHSDVYNRYQHLFFNLTKNNSGAPFVITNPFPDVVRVNITGRDFDFALTGATVVASPTSEDSELAENPGLVKLLSADGWSWYRISHHP
ncbi:DUF7657 domain-containing protein [Pseudomonas monteilii]|uniref:Uncharacterized protein n=1 Tax=Pseudomonas monteilii TaxID=76759 RepID=A0A399M2J4_9PSED|nr:hypothetical protein [Pseudomonas monteilii]RII75942.1 hypothetical protein D0894_19415 [Pseudomonas monteilii]